MGKQIVDAIKAANKPFVPIADADIGGFVSQLLDPTNFPASRRGRYQYGLRRRRGITWRSSSSKDRPSASPPALAAEHGPARPVLLDNTTDAARPLSRPGSRSRTGPVWPLSLAIKDWTTYDPNTFRRPARARNRTVLS